MNMSLFSAMLCCIVGPVVLPGQTRTSASDRSCVESLELPTRGLFAARAGASGEVHAVVRIGKDGQVDKLDLTGANQGLQAEVRVANEPLEI
jgi:hypothetical protein